MNEKQHKMKIFDNNKCSICLVSPQQNKALIGCGHVFCRTCITEWSKVSLLCPECKKLFSPFVSRDNNDHPNEQRDRPLPPVIAAITTPAKRVRRRIAHPGAVVDPTAINRIRQMLALRQGRAAPDSDAQHTNTSEHHRISTSRRPHPSIHQRQRRRKRSTTKTTNLTSSKD